MSHLQTKRYWNGRSIGRWDAYVRIVAADGRMDVEASITDDYGVIIRGTGHSFALDQMNEANRVFDRLVADYRADGFGGPGREEGG